MTEVDQFVLFHMFHGSVNWKHVAWLHGYRVKEIK